METTSKDNCNNSSGHTESDDLQNRILRSGKKYLAQNTITRNETQDFENITVQNKSNQNSPTIPHGLSQRDNTADNMNLERPEDTHQDNLDALRASEVERRLRIEDRPTASTEGITRPDIRQSNSTTVRPPNETGDYGNDDQTLTTDDLQRHSSNRRLEYHIENQMRDQHHRTRIQSEPRYHTKVPVQDERHNKRTEYDDRQDYDNEVFQHQRGHGPTMRRKVVPNEYETYGLFLEERNRTQSVDRPYFDSEQMTRRLASFDYDSNNRYSDDRGHSRDRPHYDEFPYNQTRYESRDEPNRHYRQNEG